MARRIIVGNWKMNTTKNAAEKLAANMRSPLQALDGIQTVLCPPFVSLASVGEVLDGSGVGVGAQNMYHENNGAFTGEISPVMLSELCTFVILGHSERRNILGETDEIINKKIKAAYAAGLVPIMCVGEQLWEKESDFANKVVERQILKCLSGIQSVQELVVAYEPVWAIGTGHAATPNDAQYMNAYIRQTLANKYGDKSASEVRLLYGGSVTSDNVASFVGMPDVDGALVGGASLDSTEFIRLVENSALA